MSPIFRLIAFTKKFKTWYLFMGFFVVAVSLLSLVTPLLSKIIVDLIVAHLSKGGGIPSQAFYILAAIIATDVLITVLTAISQWMGDILAVRLQTFLSKSFYQHILNLNIGFYDNAITGQIVNKMYRGIQSVTDFIQSMLNNFLPFFLTAVVTILLLAKYSPIIAILLAVLFPIYILISNSSSQKWQKFEGQKNSIADSCQGRVFESISGIRVVKAFASEMKELLAFVSAREKIEKLAISQTREWHYYDFLRRLALNIILFAIYAYIVYSTFYKKFTLGEMTLLLQLVNQARFPLFAMSFILGQIQQASAGSKDFFDVLAVKNKIKDKIGAKDLVVPNDNNSVDSFIEFRHVDFEYESNMRVLHDINFCVSRNEKLALVGESGQGKSTIVNLLLRYYEPQKGEILVCDQNISEVSQNSLHLNQAVVFQESLLFSGTIMENILYGNDLATRQQAIEAAKAANADEFISGFSEGYDSLIGERGVKLSGGQKQRISIARAMLKNAPIIVLDEATSSLDSKSEILVQQGLDRLLKNRTSIIIAHRLSTIASADHILVIAHGKVAEYGTQNDLLQNKNGLYSELVALQQKLLTATPDEKQEMLKKFDLVG
jgi:ATP-binding cassette, subfamily B, bacterial